MMRLTESGIVHERGAYWVYLGRAGQHARAYTVFGPHGHVASVSDSAYPATSDGRSCAIARADYLARRAEEKK